MSADPLLSVRDLRKHYAEGTGLLGRGTRRVRAVDGASFDVGRGETVGLVGETGCGKSTAAASLLRIEEPTGGTVRFDGEDVTSLSGAELARFRRRTGMVFQDPTSSFDPRMSVGESVAEPLAVHGMADRGRRRRIVEDLLGRVGLSADDADRYPHELSGGQKQRAGLARALALNPDLLVADEPVSALDVSVQAEILSLLDDLQRDLGLSVLLITHDMAVVREVCDRVAVMYLGEVVEAGPTDGIFEDPAHPYTRALVASVPTPDPGADRRRATLSGEIPDPSDPPDGCRFHTRCPEVIGPEGYDLDGATWRAVLDLRAGIAEGVLAGPDATAGDAAGALREEYGIPAELDDPGAEAVLSAALSALVDGDREAAAARLAEEFGTVCERRDPERVRAGEGWTVSCHLHDPAVAEPEPE